MSMLNLVASLVKTGVRGRIFSSDSGTVEGHCLAQSQSREKITRLMLEEQLPITIDCSHQARDMKLWPVCLGTNRSPRSSGWKKQLQQILFPDITLEGNTLGSICD